jgi:hypothetical protein
MIATFALFFHYFNTHKNWAQLLVDYYPDRPRPRLWDNSNMYKNDLLDRGYGRPPHAPIEVPTPPSEVPEFPTVEEIDAELRRRGLLTVRELVAQERAREAAIAAARPKAPT